MADDEDPEDDSEPNILQYEEDSGPSEGSKSPTISKTPSAGTKSDRSVKSGSSPGSPSTITEEDTAESLEDKVSKSQEELSKSEDISLNGKKTSLEQLSVDRVQRGKKMYRQCHRRFREIIGKREMKNEELVKQTGDLQQRLNILECSMPAVMVWNIWRMTQGTGSVKLPCLKRALEKQFEGPAAGETYCPSTPSRHFDCRVREVEAERKQALKRVEEARTLWAEKMTTLEDRNKRLKEAKRIQEETKEKIAQLTAESQRLRDALPKEPEDGECEAGECGVIECKKKWLEKVPSNASIKTTDIECLQRLQELAEKELAMKRQIADLERREEAYMRTLQQADELWCRLEGDAASTMSALQEQLDQKVAANLKMADRICELEDVIEKLMGRLSNCRGELEKYISVTKIEALIGRDDDFAEILDKEVVACAEWKEKRTGMDGDLVGVSDKGLMAKATTDDAEIEIHPEDFEKAKLAAAEDYLARLGSLSELDNCEDDFVCGIACNDVVLTESGLTEEEMKALEENRVTARMLMEKTGMDMEAELAKVRELLEEGEVPVKSEEDLEIEKEKMEEAEEEYEESQEEFEEAEEEFKEDEMDEKEFKEEEESAEEDEVSEEAEDEVSEEAEGEDVGEIQVEVIEEEKEEVTEEAEEEIEEAVKEEVAEEVEAAVAEEAAPVEEDFEEAFKEPEGAIVTEIVDVATEPTAIVADENNVLVSRDEMISWKDDVDLIRSTVARCSDCVVVKKDADELATKLAAMTGTEMTEIPEAVPTVKTEAPEPVAEAPPVEAEAPPVVAEAPPVAAEVPEPVAEAPPAAAEAPPAAAEAPEPVAEAPPVAAEAPEPVAEAPPAAAEAPEPVAEAPPVATEAPEPVAEAPEPVAEAPEPMAEAPEPVAEAPEPVPEVTETVVEEPEDMAEIPETPEVAAEVPEDEGEVIAEEEPPGMPTIDEVKEEEEEEVMAEALAEGPEDVTEEELKPEDAIEEEAKPEAAIDEELLPPEAIEEKPEEEEEAVISVEVEEKEQEIPVQVLPEEEAPEPSLVEEKPEEEEEEGKRSEEQVELEEIKEPVPSTLRESEESISEDEEIICTCAPRAPVPKPVMKVEITQTEITRIETIQVITQTTEDIGIQTIPGPALQQTHTPQITTTTRTVDADSEMIEKIFASRRPPVDQIAAVSYAESSQAFMAATFPVRGKEAPPSGFGRKADGVQRPGTEREIRSVLYSKKSDMEEGKCNCCLCANAAKSSTFDVPKYKKETQDSDAFFKFLSTLPTLKETSRQPVDKQVDIVKCSGPGEKPLKTATREQDLCTCGPPPPKSSKVTVKKCDQSCMAKISKLKPERIPTKKKGCGKKDVDFDEHHCPCAGMVDTSVPGVQKRIYCACGDPD